MLPYFDSAWFGQVRRMRRSDPIYKPAMLLAAVDLIEEGLATADHVPLALAVERFDALLAQAGLLETKGSSRGFMPAFHLSTCSKTEEPFWALLHFGSTLGPREPPKSVRTLLDEADAVRIDDVLAEELSSHDGRAIVRAAIYRLLEDDGRPDCLALLASHDVDKPSVDRGVQSLLRREQESFQLDDPGARNARSVREQIVRDRTLRLAVLPAYDFACALCSTRIIWNNLSEVEAAHIKPRSLKGADDRRNALSLCQTHHWAFDLGLWSANDDLRVIVGAPVEMRGDDLAALRAFDGNQLCTPRELSARPHPDALRWHREHRFERVA